MRPSGRFSAVQFSCSLYEKYPTYWQPVSCHSRCFVGLEYIPSLFVYRLMRRTTSLMRTSEIKFLFNSSSSILELIFVNVKPLIMLMLFSEQTRGWTACTLRATWCQRAPLWWLVRWTINMHRSKRNTHICERRRAYIHGSNRAQCLERNSFSAKNQTLQDFTECIFRLRCRHHQLLFK